MRDEDIRQPPLLLQPAQQVQDLRLNGHIQRRDRLVADDELRVHRQRPRDAHALAAAAVQLVRIGVHQPLVQTHGLHQLQHLGKALIGVAVFARERQRFVDGLRDGELGVERGKRVLKDQLHIPPQLLEPAPADLGDVLAVKEDFARRGLDQPQDRPPERRLAAAGLADHAQRRAPRDGKRHIVDRVELPGADLKIFFEVSDLQNILSHARVPPHSPAAAGGFPPCAHTASTLQSACP